MGMLDKSACSVVRLLHCLPNILPKKLNLTHPNEGLEGYTTVRSFLTVKYFFCFLLVDWYFRGKDNKGTTTDAVRFGRCTRTALRVRQITLLTMHDCSRFSCSCICRGMPWSKAVPFEEITFQTPFPCGAWNSSLGQVNPAACVFNDFVE